MFTLNLFKNNKKRRPTRRNRVVCEALENRQLMAADLAMAAETAADADVCADKATQCKRLDFGDAPDSYGTTLAADGARHVPGWPRLGKTVDTEVDGQPSASATRDGLDEDGVMFLGSAVSVVGRGVVDAWADTDGNGRFDEDEKFIDAATLSPGTNYFFAPSTYYYRFRVSRAGGLEATGFGGYGEVEDYCRTHFGRDCEPNCVHDSAAKDNTNDEESQVVDKAEDKSPYMVAARKLTTANRTAATFAKQVDACFACQDDDLLASLRR